MSVSLYFGLPGCGKTTIACAMIVNELKKMDRGESPYKQIYTNFAHNIEDIRVIPIRFDYLGKYDIRDGLVIIDEATLEADNRDYKKFSFESKQFFLLHRHYNCDIVMLTQQWDGIDKKIRVITDRVYYIYKSPLLGKWISRYYQIPYGIIIPDPKHDDAEKLGDIIQGYCKPSLLKRMFSPIVFRPKYYRYFDSWEAPILDPIPTTLSGSRKVTEVTTATDKC